MPLDRARLGREPRHARDVEVRGLRSDEKVGVEVDRRVDAAGAIHADRDRRARALARVRIHPQREAHVVVGREKDLAHWDGLKGLLGDLAQDRRRVETDLGPLGRRNA